MRIGYLAQGHETEPPDRTPIEFVRDMKPMYEEDAVALLGRFLFRYDQMRQPVGSLSGGERTRLQLCLLMLSGANCLLLDEPTNHLDIDSMEVLESALESYDGTVIVISHDRYLLDRIPDRIVEVRDGQAFSARRAATTTGPRPGGGCPRECRGAALVRRRRRALATIEREVVACRACPRLVEWRERTAREKVARFADETYWARPVPGFGDPEAGVLVLGLAPAAHGGNRTGRIFTGDRSGDFLFGSMHRMGLANQATSESVGDGLRLHGAFVSAVNRCAPPANKPTPAERDRCLPFLAREMRGARRRLRVVVALGAFAWDGALRAAGRARPSQRAPSLGSGTGPRRRSGRTRCSDASIRASRTPSPGSSRCR